MLCQTYYLNNQLIKQYGGAVFNVVETKETNKPKFRRGKSLIENEQENFDTKLINENKFFLKNYDINLAKNNWNYYNRSIKLTLNAIGLNLEDISPDTFYTNRKMKFINFKKKKSLQKEDIPNLGIGYPLIFNNMYLGHCVLKPGLSVKIYSVGFFQYSHVSIIIDDMWSFGFVSGESTSSRKSQNSLSVFTPDLATIRSITLLAREQQDKNNVRLIACGKLTSIHIDNLNEIFIKHKTGISELKSKAGSYLISTDKRYDVIPGLKNQNTYNCISATSELFPDIFKSDSFYGLLKGLPDLSQLSELYFLPINMTRLLDSGFKGIKECKWGTIGLRGLTDTYLSNKLNNCIKKNYLI